MADSAQLGSQRLMRAALLCVLAIIPVTFVASHYGRTSHQGTDRRVLYYVDPMHPSYRSDKPGVAPDCGMALTAIYEGDNLSSKLQLPPGAVYVSPSLQKLIGLKIEVLAERGASTSIRTTGRVAPDENRSFRLIAATDGWIRSMPTSVTGARVRKGELLARLSSPAIFPAVQAYLVSRAALERTRAITQTGSRPDEQRASAESAFHRSEMQLRALGMGDPQITELARTGQPTADIEVVSPSDGIILSRNVLLEQQCELGMELYRVVDIDSLWIMASVSADGQKGLRSGARARVSSAHFPGILYATVERTEPFFDSASHTLQLYLRADNLNHLLWPEMDVDVQIDIPGPAGLFLPMDAVLDSESGRVVYVQTSEGVFQRRRIDTGITFGERIGVASGLKPGEKVVTSGTFLLNSASLMSLPHLQ